MSLLRFLLLLRRGGGGKPPLNQSDVYASSPITTGYVTLDGAYANVVGPVLVVRNGYYSNRQ